MSERAAGPVVHVVTLGCPKNEADSDRMAASLSGSFRLVEDAGEADVVVVNTCAFITEAVEESIGVVLGFAEWKAARPGRALVVAGCMPSRYGEEVRASLPEVDAFVPVADEAAIVEVLTGLTGALPADGPPACTRTSAGPSAYLEISDGCHRRCTFCTIPGIRGDYRSRPESELLAEAAELIARGVSEIVLVGQDVSAWGRDLPGRPMLARLVRSLARLEGIGWLRLMYVQPDGVTPELLEVMADEPAVCRYLDMPLQHASREVLTRMGRRGDAAEFVRLAGTVRSLLPGVFLRTTLIAGFPGETRHDSGLLERFVRDAAFDYTGVFAYSPEDGTPAAALPGQVPPRMRRARAQRLRDIADEVGGTRAAALVGTRLTVLVDGVDENGVTTARHMGQAPEVDGCVLLDRECATGSFVEVEIVDSLGYDLVGEVR